MTRILRRAGIEVHAFSGLTRRSDFEREGACFHDLFQSRPIEATDNHSFPLPMRQVGFAARYSDSLAAEIRALRPQLIIYGTFSVIGMTVAQILQLPSVAICAGHNLYPQRALEIMAKDPRVYVAEECWQSIAVLRARYGIERASPFLYYDTLSPHLNIIGEPPEFLAAEDQARFSPSVFMGAISSDRLIEPAHRRQNDKLRIYVSFGTIAANYFKDNISQTIAAIRDVFGSLRNCQTRIGLGIQDAPQDLQVTNSIEIISWANQWNELQQADLHITHHGMNSTHESCFHEVPMLSHPFLGDQPFLAARCQELGLALPLQHGALAPVTRDQLATTFEHFLANRRAFRERLLEARQWELKAIRNQAAVAEAILAVAGNSSP